MTVGYNFAAQRHGLYSEKINLATLVATLADGRPVFGGPKIKPAFNQINLIESGGNTNYNVMFVSLKKSLTQGLLVNVTWTWSHAPASTVSEGRRARGSETWLVQRAVCFHGQHPAIAL